MNTIRQLSRRQFIAETIRYRLARWLYKHADRLSGRGTGERDPFTLERVNPGI